MTTKVMLASPAALAMTLLHQHPSRSSFRPLRALALSAVIAAIATGPSAAGHSGNRSTHIVGAQLQIARELAVTRLQEQERCRDLFLANDANGIDLLRNSTFRLATPTEHERVCRRRRAALFTHIAGSEIVVCTGEFQRLPVRHRAAMLLHEALHHAGVSEQPFDPDALTSAELTRLVELRCRL